MPNKANLQLARKNRYDEFYTYIEDINKELRYYKSKFEGKIIYCNCDDPFESKFLSILF